MTPLVSIGVTSFDRLDLLRNTLDLILSQSFKDFEVLIGNDNPSRTLTPELLGSSDSRVRIINRPRNLGELGNMNALLAESSGRYFTWTADDDLYAFDFLERVHSAFLQFPGVPVVYTAYRGIRGTEPKRPPAHDSVPAVEYSGRQFLRLYMSGAISLIGVMGVFEKSFLQSMGGLDDVSEDGMGLQTEYHLIHKSALAPRVAYVPSPLVFYRSHEGTWGPRRPLDHYRRAARLLAHRSLRIFLHPSLREDLEQNSFHLFRQCVFSVLTVMWRNGRPPLNDVWRFLRETGSYLDPVRNDERTSSLGWSLQKARVAGLWAHVKNILRSFLPPSTAAFLLRIRDSAKGLLGSHSPPG